MGLHPERSEWKLLVALAPKIQHWTCAGITTLGHSWVVKATWILPRAVPFFAPSPTKWWYSTGWWFATWILFSHILEIIIPTDFHIFQRETTNQNGDTTINEWLDGSDLQHLLRNPDGAIVGRFVYMLATTTKSWSKSRWKSHFFWLKHVHQSWYWTIKIIIFQSLKRQILIIFDANSNCNILDYSNRISADLLIPVLQ